MAGSCEIKFGHESVRGRRKHLDLIRLTIFWIVWKETNMRDFGRADDVDGFNVLKNRWF